MIHAERVHRVSGIRNSPCCLVFLLGGNNHNRSNESSTERVRIFLRAFHPPRLIVFLSLWRGVPLCAWKRPAPQRDPLWLFVQLSTKFVMRPTVCVVVVVAVAVPVGRQLSGHRTTTISTRRLVPPPPAPQSAVHTTTHESLSAPLSSAASVLSAACAASNAGNAGIPFAFGSQRSHVMIRRTVVPCRERFFRTVSTGRAHHAAATPERSLQSEREGRLPGHL